MTGPRKHHNTHGHGVGQPHARSAPLMHGASNEPSSTGTLSLTLVKASNSYHRILLFRESFRYSRAYHRLTSRPPPSPILLPSFLLLYMIGVLGIEKKLASALT